MTNYIHALIVDDDTKICSLLKQLLFKNNVIALHALNVVDAKKMLNYYHCDVMILDYMLPHTNGIQFLKEIRKYNHNLPIIMLTAINETEVKLDSLQTGADDFLAKPFHSTELILRIQNLVKRTSNLNHSHHINFSGMVFNLKTKELTLNHQTIPLSTLEETLLEIFINSLGKVVTKEEILTKLGKSFTEENFNSINVSIMRLRKKIETQQKCLKTIRNQGFLLRP